MKKKTPKKRGEDVEKDTKRNTNKVGKRLKVERFLEIEKTWKKTHTHRAKFFR